MLRVPPQEFDQIVERGFARIAPRFRQRMRNVLLTVEREPPQPDLLGLFQSGDPFAMPDRITIYQGPHERMARNLRELEKIVADTVWHEVAHFFGMNERQVERAERRRRIR